VACKRIAAFVASSAVAALPPAAALLPTAAPSTVTARSAHAPMASSIGGSGTTATRRGEFGASTSWYLTSASAAAPARSAEP
jgi:hypothetical protein